MTATDECPSAPISFANNFWGKNDAGVGHLLERMTNAKQTCDELKAFYNARAAIEDEYARKLLQLSRKPLGQNETGTLKASLDVVRGETAAMSKAHQSIATQIKSDLEEPLAVWAGGMKERRKIVQQGIEKLLKVKQQQTAVVNKTRERYEGEALKIKGYLAQGHMVMGQEERKVKAKQEKAQINLANANVEYEQAVKVVEETFARWNRDWKHAADKFQDLEEERLDFTKSSLWTFANIASTVCVSDDGSCESIRLSLEHFDLQKDINDFIKEKGTGQEIPDPPKYINYCRGDIDSTSEASEDENYSVAQFQRTINPAFRSSSPQPSTYESHHDPESALAKDLGHFESPQIDNIQPDTPSSREATLTPQKAATDRARQAQLEYQQTPSRLQYEESRSSVDRARQPRVDSVPEPTSRKGSQALADSSRQPRVEPEQTPRRLEYGNNQAVADRSRQPRVEPEQTPRRLEYGNNQAVADRSRQPRVEPEQTPRRLEYGNNQVVADRSRQPPVEPEQSPRRLQYDEGQYGSLATVPHDPYPQDGMTMLCRTGPPSERSAANNSLMRPNSRDSQSEYSNPTSFDSQELPSGKSSPVKAQKPVFQPQPVLPPPGDREVQKKKSGFFQNRSPFRRKSKREAETSAVTSSSNRNTWSAGKPSQYTQESPVRSYGKKINMLTDRPSGSPEPVDPRATYQLNIGNNVFDVASPDKKSNALQKSKTNPSEEVDPVEAALMELKGLNKQSSLRSPVDSHYGVKTPAPDSAPAERPVPPFARGALASTPPPSYDQPVSLLGAPQPAHTSKAMRQSTQKYVDQTQNMFRTSASSRPDSSVGFSNSQSRPSMPPSSAAFSNSQGRPSTRGSDMVRAPSPAAPRAASPRPATQSDDRQYRAASPNPYAGQQPRQHQQRSASRDPYASQQQQQQRPRYSQSASPQKRGPSQGYGRQNAPADVVRGVSPAPFRQENRPSSSRGSEMAMQLAPVPDAGGYGSQRSGRPMSQYGGPGGGQLTMAQPNQVAAPRSKSVADNRQFNRDGIPILNFARALYSYTAAIPEELSFQKGDTLAVLALQDDGWWQAEVAGKNGRPGLVPSNYLQNI